MQANSAHRSFWCRRRSAASPSSVRAAESRCDSGTVFVDRRRCPPRSVLPRRSRMQVVQPVWLPQVRDLESSAARPVQLRREQSDAAAQAIARLYRVEPMNTFCGVARGLLRRRVN